MNGRATRAVRWAARGIVSWSREGRRGRASEAEGVASVRDRRHVCVWSLRAREGAGVRGACAHLRHSSSTSSSVEQRKEEVDPAGLEVRGEGDGPHPANRCARPHAGYVRVGAPSLGPASDSGPSCWSHKGKVRVHRSDHDCSCNRRVLPPD